MQETPQEAWYFTREGARLGPVTLAELRAKVGDGTLNPRLDLVWTQGMADWKPAGEIDGLFERPPLPPPISLAPATDSHVPPQNDSVEQSMSRITDWPGARRRSFLIATLLFPFGWNFALAFSTEFLTQQLGTQLMGVVSLGAACVPVLVAIYYGLQRLANLGMSRWWCLAIFVPLLNLWVGYRCVACPAGYAYHKQLDGAGIFLAIVYWLAVALGVLALAGLVALFFGALGTPALQEQLHEAFRNLIEQSTPR